LTSLERGRVPSPRSAASKEVPLVDRAEEMNVLREVVYGAVHGEGGLVFVHGEAGIGKTRLLREVGGYAQSRGVQVLHGKCPALFRMDGVPPYVIWTEVIRDYLETCTPEQLYRVIGFYPAEVAKLVPELSQKLRTMPQSFQISPEQEQNRLFEAVSQFIINISRETPLLVILDDLQWTDPSSLLLLHYLARGVQRTSMLILGAYRTTDVDDKHPLTPILAELKRERLPQSVSLKRMSFDDISEMIRQILEQDDVPPELYRLIYEKTRGNPFFAEEVTQSLKEEEVIYREQDRWKFKEVSAIEFPESVKNVVKARISRLDEDCQNVLTLASFVGNDFSFEAIRGVTNVEEDKLLELMEKLLKTGLVKERVIRGKDVYCFADVVVRDVVHEEASRLRHKKLHDLVGSTLEKVYAKEIDQHFGELAYHFLEGDEKDRALDYFLKAGEKAMGIYANAEAASYFESALKLLGEKEGGLQERERVLERLGDIESLLGKHGACLKHWDEALLISTKLQEKQKTATLHRKMANLLYEKIGDKQKAEEHHEAALKILETEPESVELARLYEDIAHMHYRVGEIAKAFSLCEKALELAKKLDAPEVVASSYVSLGTIFIFIGERNKAFESLERALKIALDNGYMETALRSYNNLGAGLPPEENERMFECAEKGYDLAKKVGEIYMQSWASLWLGWVNVGRGDMNKAVPLLEESVALDKKSGNMTHLSVSLALLGVVYQILGEWDKSEQCHKEASSILQRTNEWQMTSVCYWAHGWLYLEKGEYAEARELFEKAVGVIEKVGAKGALIDMFRLGNRWLTWTCIELGENEKAAKLIDAMQKSALETNDKGLTASADALQAMLFRSERKWDESISIFEKSLKEFEDLGARQWNTYVLAKMVLYEYARVLLERNQQGDKEKARDLLDQASGIFQRMGAKKDIEKVEAKIGFIETGKVVSKPKPTEYVSTGYADLDRLLYGGIPLDYAVVLTSPSCDERDLLIKSFLGTGVKSREVTFYVTINASLARALSEKSMLNLQIFVCNPEAEAIIKSSSSVHSLKGVENLTDISIALTSAIRQLEPALKGPRRICLELVSDVLLQHHAVETRRWLTALLTKLKSEDFTTLAIIDPQMHPSEELHAILGLFEGEISIYEKETDKGRGKYLKIQKMSGQKYLEDEVSLEKEQL
jgi:predicted ATPase/KaiC/GvpD/RAD55 family RecA-like ATPase/Tfp pilus assembly protein PilF